MIAQLLNLAGLNRIILAILNKSVCGQFASLASLSGSVPIWAVLLKVDALIRSTFYFMATQVFKAGFF